MKLVLKNDFLEKSNAALSTMYDKFINLDKLEIEEFNKEDTALIVVDLVNGFIREGMLKSDRVESIIEVCKELMIKCENRGIEILAFADWHINNSAEFQSYPPHCIGGTSEAELVDEIKENCKYRLIKKNSTNGFMESEFRTWLETHDNIKNFIVVGDCTDICVMHFSLSLKTYFNSMDKTKRIIVPVDSVETYSLNDHDGDLMNIISLQILMWNGIDVVEHIK